MAVTLFYGTLITLCLHGCTMMKFNAWGHCFDCHFEGMLEYSHIEGEEYEGVEAVMLLQHCPACETTEHALIPIDYYEEMMEELRARLEAAEGQ